MATFLYDDEYCCNLIKVALTDTDKNINIKTSKIKRLIISKVETLKEGYGLHYQEIYSDITFNFLAKSKIIKIDNEKGSPTTFILQYVFNQLRNIEKKCQRGTFFHNNTRKADAMKLIDEGMDMLLEGMDYDDPETIMIRRETVEQMKKFFTLAELEMMSSNNINKSLAEKLDNFRSINDL